jgi:hypothetical protein
MLLVQAARPTIALLRLTLFQGYATIEMPQPVYRVRFILSEDLQEIHP